MLPQAESAVWEIVKNFELLFRRTIGINFLAGSSRSSHQHIAIALIRNGPETIAEGIKHESVRRKAGHRDILGDAQATIGGDDIRRRPGHNGGNYARSGNREHVGIV